MATIDEIRAAHDEAQRNMAASEYMGNSPNEDKYALQVKQADDQQAALSRPIPGGEPPPAPLAPPVSQPALSQQPVTEADFQKQIGALSTYTPANTPYAAGPGQGALAIEQPAQDNAPDEWWAASKEGVEKASRALDSFVDNDGVTSSDIVKTAAAAVITQGAQALFERARSAQKEQLDRLREQMAVEPDKDKDPVEHAKWRAAFDSEITKLQAGGEINPTFWGTFVKPILAPDGETSFAQKLQNLSGHVLKSRTPEAQAASEKQLLPSKEMLAKNFNAGDPSTWFKGTSMPWEDLDAFALTMAQQAPSFAAGFTANRIAARSSRVVTGVMKRAEGVLNPEIVRRAADKGAIVWGTAAGLATDFMITKEQVESQIDQGIKDPETWDNEDNWRQNPDYVELTAHGVPSETAKQMLANEAAVVGSTAAAVISTLGEAPLQKYFAKIGIGDAVSRAGAAAKTGASAAAVNALQEGNEQLWQNWEQRKFDPQHPMTDQVLNSMVGGLMIGGPVGFASGAMAGGEAPSGQFNKDQKKLIESGFSDWRALANERSELQAKIGDPDYIANTAPRTRLKEFTQLEDLKLRESRAFKRAEPVIREMQDKYGATPESRTRVEKFTAQHDARIEAIYAARKARWNADNVQQTEEQAAKESAAVQKQIEDDHGKLAEFTQTRDDLATVQEGGAIEGDNAMDRYQRLTDQGFGRWTSNKKEKFVLTPSGRNARDSIDTAINSQQQKIDSGYAGPEKRGTPRSEAERKEWAGLTEEERFERRYRDTTTGVRSASSLAATNDAVRKGEQEAPKSVAFVDGDSLGWVNSWGQHKGDEYIAKIGKAFKDAGLADVTFRNGGDEFVVHGDSDEQVEAGMKQVQQHLSGMTISNNEGTQQVTPDITWGIGPDQESADTAMRGAKAAKVAAGLRSKKGEKPVSLRDVGPGTPPLLMYNGKGEPTEINALIDQISKLVNAKDEFSRKRAEKLDRRLSQMILAGEERTNLSRFAQEMMDMMGARSAADGIRAKIISQAKIDYMSFSPELKGVYETRASEFFTPLAGKAVSGLDAYLMSIPDTNRQHDLLPSFSHDHDGNIATGEQTAAYQAIDRLLNEGVLPKNVANDVREISTHWESQGFPEITPAEVMLTRVHRYLGIEQLAGGPTPFSTNLAEYKKVQAEFEDAAYPLLWLQGDPITAPRFYSTLQKGSKVEMIARGESVSATVISANDDSVVVKWDADAKVFDPDTQKKTNTARFSKTYGWQISARLARGGKSYGRQYGAWPGQARLGRRWNEERETWETAAAEQARRDTVMVGNGSKIALKGLRPSVGIRATKNEMRRARVHANQLLAGARNLPMVTLVNSTADLPIHMQVKLVNHGSNGMGVQGMFDEQDPQNGVWVMVGNTAKYARDNNLTLDRAIAEAVLHETIGHYGLRGFMGNDEQLARHMDAVARSFPAEVEAKGRSYGFMRDSARPATNPTPLMSADIDSIRALMNRSGFVDLSSITEKGSTNTFAKKLKALTKERGVTQRELSDRTGIEYQRMVGIMNAGRSHATNEEINKILDAIGGSSIGENTNKRTGPRTPPSRAEFGVFSRAEIVAEANKILATELPGASVATRTINFYRTSRLLPKALTRGAGTGYPIEYAHRIVRIRKMQAEGMSIAQIREAMDKAPEIPAPAPAPAVDRTNDAQIVNDFVGKLRAAGITDRAITRALGEPIDKAGILTNAQMNALVALADSHAEQVDAAPPPMLKSGGQSSGSEWISEAHRLLAAEEFVAEMAQKVIADNQGLLPKPQMNVLQRIMNHVRSWLAGHGFGRFMRGPLKMTDRDIAMLLWNAQDFVRNGQGWRYMGADGRMLTPFMRDKDIFRSSVLTQMQWGKRPTTSDERKQAKKRGDPVVQEVPLFPEEATRAHYNEILKKLAKDGKIKQTELDAVDLDGLMRDLRYGHVIDIMRLDDPPNTVSDDSLSVLPPRMREEYKKALDVLNADNPIDAKLILDDAKLQLEMLEAGFFADTEDAPMIAELKAKIERLSKFPTNEELDAAGAFMNSLTRDGPMPDSAKIPLRVLLNAAHERAFKVRMMPGGRGYESYDIPGDTEGDQSLPDRASPQQIIDASTNTDINPYNWKDRRPTDTDSYSSYAPYGESPDSWYGSYVLYSENPPISDSVGHDGFGTRVSGKGQFMHIRYRESQMVDGEPAWELVEIQSDLFQGIEGKAGSENELRTMSTDALRTISNIATSIHVPLTDMTNRVEELYKDAYEKTKEQWRSAGLTFERARQIMQQTQHALLMPRVDELTDLNKVIGDELRAIPSGLASDDARAFHKLDLLALKELADQLYYFATNQLTHNVFDPDNVLFPNDNNFLWTQAKTHIARDTRSSGSNARATARVMAKPHLFERYMKLVGALGGHEYTAEEIAALRDTMSKASTPTSALIPSEVMSQVSSALGGGDDPLYTIQNSLQSMAARGTMSALGVDAMNMSFQHTDEGLRITATAAPGTDLGAVLRDYLTNAVRTHSANKWSREEDARIQRLKMAMENTSHREMGVPMDPSAALQAINFDNGMSDPDWVRRVDVDDYIGENLDSRIQSIRDNGNEWDYLDGDDLYYDGEVINRDHPEYLRIAHDQSESDADDWLSERQSEAIDQQFDSGDARDKVRREVRNEFPGDTITWTFEIPIRWDADGDPVQFIDGAIVENNGTENDEGNVEVDPSFYVRADDKDGDPIFEDWATDSQQARRLLLRQVAEHYASEGIDLPGDSPFRFVYQGDEGATAPEALQQEMQRREMPDFSEMAQALTSAEFPTTQVESKPMQFDKAWERAVLSMKVQEWTSAKNHPFSHRDVWTSIGIKFAIADAIRKGKTRVIWQGGEATGSRGGWGEHEYWRPVDEVEWQRKRVTLNGKESDVYTITDVSGTQIMLEPGRLIPYVGADVANLITQRGTGKDEAAVQRALEENFDVVKQGEDRYAVTDAQQVRLVGIFDNKRLADAAREFEIRRAHTAMKDTGSYWGTIKSFEVGGRINLALTSRMPNQYSDTLGIYGRGAELVRGARTSYDVILKSQIKSVVKPFGGEVVEDVKHILHEENYAVNLNGARIVTKVSGPFAAKYPNMHLERFAGRGRVQPGWLLVSDRGVFSGTLHETEREAMEELRSVLDSESELVKGIKVYTIKINDKMKEFFGAGGIPILAKSPIIGNPILEAAAKRIGQTVQPITLRQRVQDLRQDWSNRWQQGMFDRFHGIKAAMRKVDWQGPAERNPYIQARLTTSLDTQMRAVLEHGAPVWKDGIMQTAGKGLLDILEPVGKNLEAWGMYMAGVRAQRLMNEGRENNFTQPQITEMINLGNQFPEFGRVAAEYAAFNKAVLDFAQQAGVIDPVTRPTWENADYVPFYRVVDNKLTGPMSGGRGVANVKKQIKQLKGGQQALQDITTNIIQNTANLIDASMKNHAALTAIDGLKGLGIIHKIPLDMKPEIIPMAQVRAKLIAAGINPAHIPANALQGFQTMFAVKAPEGPGKVSLLRDGKREYYETEDRLLYEALSAINMKQFGDWIKLFRGPKRLLTLTVTLDPGFMLRNFMRDLLSAFTISRDHYEPFTRAAQGFKQALLTDESMRTMMSAGAAFDSGYLNTNDSTSVHRAIGKSMRMKNKGVASTILDTPGKLFDAYKAVGAAVENANRVAVYNAAIAAGKGKAQAAFEAKDLMDFSMGGSWGAVQFLLQSVPFMGARLQGLHRMGRGFMDNPIAFTLKGMLIGMAGMALYSMFKDDERYKELTEYDRDTYFHFWVQGEHYRLPKSFEVGVVFNTIPERAYDYIVSNDGDAGKLLFQRFGFALSQTFSMNPIPQTISPVVESFFNTSFFTQQQIVNPYEETRLPPEQMRAGTSPTFVELARALPPGIDAVGLKKLRSPLHLENMYKGYMGTLGQYMLKASDAIVSKMMDYPDKPTPQVADMPVIGSFYRGPDTDPRRTKYEEVFYDLVRQVSQVKGSLSYLKKIDQKDRAKMIKAEQKPLVRQAERVGNASEYISDKNDKMMKVWMNPDMTGDEKRVRLNELQHQKNDRFLKMYDYRPGGAKNNGDEDPEDAQINYLLDRFDVSEMPRELEKQNSPATADLVRDILALPKSQLAAIK